jgi:hypothetical protein
MLKQGMKDEVDLPIKNFLLYNLGRVSRYLSTDFVWSNLSDFLKYDPVVTVIAQILKHSNVQKYDIRKLILTAAAAVASHHA